MAAVQGHFPNRFYVDGDGNPHLNGCAFYDDNEDDISGGFELLSSLGSVTEGTVTASKAVVVDSNKDIAAFRNVTVTNLDAGASGTAGTVDVFPTTASKGKASITCADQTGNTTATLNFEQMGQATNVGIPDCGAADCDVVLTVGAQTISGAKTLTGGLIVTTTGVTITDVNVILSATTGTKIGTATTQKLGFWNATPVVQPSAYTQTYSTADKTHAAPTAATLTVADGAGTNDNTIEAITADASVIAAVQELADEINKLVADVADTKQLCNSIIDDLQTIGLVG